MPKTHNVQEKVGILFVAVVDCSHSEDQSLSQSSDLKFGQVEVIESALTANSVEGSFFHFLTHSQVLTNIMPTPTLSKHKKYIAVRRSHQ